MAQQTELWMTKYIIGEIFSSGGATLYKNPSDQTVNCIKQTNYLPTVLQNFAILIILQKIRLKNHNVPNNHPFK